MADSTNHDFGFCPVLQRMIAEQKWVDDDVTTYPAFGLSSNNNIAIIRSLMMALRPTRTMEVGLSMGASALTFAQSHSDLGHEPQGQHTAIDPWQKPILNSIGLKAMERRVSLLTFTSMNGLRICACRRFSRPEKATR